MGRIYFIGKMGSKQTRYNLYKTLNAVNEISENKLVLEMIVKTVELNTCIYL